MRVAIYTRVSTLDQHPENQQDELTRYVAARGWTTAQVYTDRGVSGTRERRPALDTLLQDARRRRFDAVLCWKLDRFGRNLRHLLNTIEDLTATGIAFISLNEGIDTNTPSGRLQLHIIGAIAQFERDRIAERVRSGLARVRASGVTLGRPRETAAFASLVAGDMHGLSHAEAARRLNVSVASIKRWRKQLGSKTPAAPPIVSLGFADDLDRVE